jgi:hypothetical protein
MTALCALLLALASLIAVPYESAETYQGIASQAGESHGPNYLAMREPRGTKARICGAGDCMTLTVNDYGPSARIRPRRVADIAVGHWERITGLPRSRGLGQVTVTILSRPHGATPTGPPTDVAP